jgi:serine/threonine protein kinase
MATALAHLHSLNIKHGEITPDTIYYEESAKHYKLVLPINRPEDPMRGWERNGDYDYPRYLVTDKYKHYLLSPEFKGYRFSKPQDVFALGGIFDVLVHSDFEDGLDGDYYRFGDAKPQKEKKIGALAKLVQDKCSPGWYMFKLIEAMREVDPEKRITAAQVARTIQDQQSKNALGTKLATVLAFYDVDIE